MICSSSIQKSLRALQVWLVLLAAPGYCAGLIVNPWVVTDRSVSCYDYPSLIADLTRGLETPQDKAIAVFRFFRRAMFPYTNRNEYPFPVNDQQHMFDFVRMVNVYGYALCTQTNWMFASVLKQSGQVEDARGISVPGHGTAEVKWDGRWHFMDAIVGCYAFRRDRREIASIEDILADSTLLSRAVAEGRASQPFCPWDGKPIYPEEALAVTDQWYTYRKYGLDFLLKVIPDYKPAEADEPSTFSMAFNLRPGFRLTRMWDNLPGMYNLSYEYYRNNKTIQTPSPSILPPHHPDNGGERLDSLNFPLIEPYRKVILGRGSYHYYANGVLSYSDDFSDRRFMQAADSISSLIVEPGNAGRGGILRCAPGDSLGEANLNFEAPYVFVGGSIRGRAEVVEGSWAAVYLDIGRTENWLCLGVATSGGDFNFPIPANLIEERYAFKIKLKLFDKSAAGSVRLYELKAEAVCQLNMYSLPFLAPGNNKVSVQAGAIPQGAALQVTYRWLERGRERADLRLVSTPGESYTIAVSGIEYPRMKDISMEYIPR